MNSLLPKGRWELRRTKSLKANDKICVFVGSYGESSPSAIVMNIRQAPLADEMAKLPSTVYVAVEPLNELDTNKEVKI